MTDRCLFDHSPAPAVERLARIEGQSNFLSLLSGVEAGPDTTEDMAALAFARQSCLLPEVLEAYYAQSGIYKRPLLSMVFGTVVSEFGPKEKDYPWIRGAIADGFLLLRYGACKHISERAKSFKVDKDAYGAMRKLAYGVLLEMVASAERAWMLAKYSRRDATGSRHGVYEREASNFPLHAAQHWATPKRHGPDKNHDQTVRMTGMEDRLSWDERNSVAGPVKVATPNNQASTASDASDLKPCEK